MVVVVLVLVLVLSSIIVLGRIVGHWREDASRPTVRLISHRYVQRS
jgi:hypothetical protein